MFLKNYLLLYYIKHTSIFPPDPISLIIPAVIAFITNYFAYYLFILSLYPSSSIDIAANDPEPVATYGLS